MVGGEKSTRNSMVVFAGGILLLVVQNLIIFRDHYFNDFGFPWDFVNGYYPMTAFWTTLVGQGIYPAWMPYYSMGMPFDLLLQTGSHYPPLWLFPLFRVEYSPHAAVIIQCLHVLFGAIGMVFFTKLLFGTTKNSHLYAFFSAFIFQFFGGFYSNAQHADIVRAFSFSPWFLYLFSVTSTDFERFGKRYYSIPVMIVLLMTGGYPGNIISTSIVVSLYFLFQIIECRRLGLEWLSLIKFSTHIIILSLLGIGLAFYHLGPIMFYKDFLVRNEQVGNFTGMATLKLAHFPSFFLENTVVPGQISMTSSYITLPALILLSFVSVRALKQNWSLVGAFLFSLIMAFGPGTFLWSLLVKILPPLGYSRFPSSDYRIFIAVVAIFFSVKSLESIINGEVNIKDFFVRFVIILIWFFLGLYIGYSGQFGSASYKSIMIFILVLISIALMIKFGIKTMGNLMSIILILLFLVILDAAKVFSEMVFPQPDGLTLSTWQVSAFSMLSETQGWELENDDRLVTYSILKNIPQRRPARIEKQDPTDFGREGFIDGKYTLNDYKSPDMLKNTSIALDDPVYKQYMLNPWSPVLVDPHSVETNGSDINIPPKSLRAEILSRTEVDLFNVQQVRYGINEIDYKILLPRPTIMVENEVYFPGWSASLVSGDDVTVINAFSVNGFFRAWMLPAGEYEMRARFEFPHGRVYNAVSIVSLIVWILLLFRPRLFPRKER